EDHLLPHRRLTSPPRLLLAEEARRRQGQHPRHSELGLPEQRQVGHGYRVLHLHLQGLQRRPLRKVQARPLWWRVGPLLRGGLPRSPRLLPVSQLAVQLATGGGRRSRRLPRLLPPNGEDQLGGEVPCPPSSQSPVSLPAGSLPPRLASHRSTLFQLSLSSPLTVRSLDGHRPSIPRPLRSCSSLDSSILIHFLTHSICVCNGAFPPSILFTPIDI
ncbi:hypothetical protein PMAYCL1PPCAC_21511, partial [Pristionchus mayeri]